MMTLDEMKSAVCKKLPELLTNVGTPQQTVVDYWHDKTRDRYPIREINWPTEGLQVCHEAEKLLTEKESVFYLQKLTQIRFKAGVGGMIACMIDKTTFATYEQRLEALCRVWWPERFK